jgi:hypothetical protein
MNQMTIDESNPYSRLTKLLSEQTVRDLLGNGEYKKRWVRNENSGQRAIVSNIAVFVLPTNIEEWRDLIPATAK